MKLAVMQPYFFPYIGYFQLIRSVDVFVSYDDVAFIKKGWINRNFLLMGCAAARFTVPLQQQSQHRPICDTRIAPLAWQKGFLKTLKQAYSRAPQFEPVYALAESVVSPDYPSVGELALGSVNAVVAYLGLATAIRSSSRQYGNSHLKGQDRVLDICLREQADTYLNLPGGRPLYARQAFDVSGVDLRFLQPAAPRYPQFDCDFVPNLSILDVLMFNEPQAVRDQLQACTTVH